MNTALYVLLLVYVTAGGPAATTAEFNTQSACEAAKQSIERDIQVAYRFVYVKCFPKAAT